MRNENRLGLFYRYGMRVFNPRLFETRIVSSWREHRESCIVRMNEAIVAMVGHDGRSRKRTKKKQNRNQNEKANAKGVTKGE